MPQKVNIGIDGIQRKADEDLRISQNVAEILGTPTGKEVLRYLRSITIEMVNGPQAPDSELRHMEGQRYLVALLEQRVAHAHRNRK